MIVVSDTSPINYLVLVEQIDRLYDLYNRVIVPSSVYEELQAPATPRAVHAWLSSQPGWLEVVSLSRMPDSGLDYLGAGERDAITLAEDLRADRLLIDDRDGRREASQRELLVIGTLGVLAVSAERGLLDLADVIDRLRATTFRASPRLLTALVERYGQKSSSSDLKKSHND
jgi:predicted nucleic acid-binding protein